MALPRILIRVTLLAGAVAISSGAALGAFIPIDTFNDLALGPINGQNEWRAPDILSTVALDPADENNQVLSVITSSTYLFHSAVIPTDEIRMLFTRFRYEEQLSVSFGMSQILIPNQFGEYDVELSLTSNKDDLRINDDGTYLELTTLEAGHWYNVWLLIDNAADVTSVWLHDRPNEPATRDDQLSIDGRTEFSFRGSVAGDLKNFFIKTGGGDGVAGPLIIDDIYLQESSGMDLSYPASAVTDVADVPSPMHLHGAVPNPFNPQTAISFTLDEPQSIQLAVFDLSGRQVVSLGEGLWDAGRHTVEWNGCDQAGIPAASGVYFVSLTGKDGIQSEKMALVR